MNEVWKTVIEDLYEVSNLGNVRSLNMLVSSTFGGHYIKEGRILKQNPNPRGYLQVILCQDGLSTTQRVHRLVAEAFIPNPFSLPEVNHKDTNIKNNISDNLEWCTGEANQLHARLAGVKTKGEKAYNSKLTEVSVREIKSQIAIGVANKEIALAYGVHPGTIQCIRTGRNWSHVV